MLLALIVELLLQLHLKVLLGSCGAALLLRKLVVQMSHLLLQILDLRTGGLVLVQGHVVRSLQPSQRLQLPLHRHELLLQSAHLQFVGLSHFHQLTLWNVILQLLFMLGDDSLCCSQLFLSVAHLRLQLPHRVARGRQLALRLVTRGSGLLQLREMLFRQARLVLQTLHLHLQQASGFPRLAQLLGHQLQLLQLLLVGGALFLQLLASGFLLGSSGFSGLDGLLQLRHLTLASGGGRLGEGNVGLGVVRALLRRVNLLLQLRRPRREGRPLLLPSRLLLI
mmetsp:Transcript_41509/g.79325  ORF Transcript_41509/g.79325 Transcript_41509/m.79325 type:complete len:280 (+) Transcript_41509:985-1824(+)